VPIVKVMGKDCWYNVEINITKTTCMSFINQHGLLL
jgi:hypothetical protein